MELPVVPAAEGYRELIADFETDCPGLRKAQVMGIAGLPAADQAWLRGDKFQMRLVTQPLRFGQDEMAFVDPVWDRAIERCWRQRWGCCGVVIHIEFVFRKELLHRTAVPPAVIMRGARDWRRIIRVQSRARLGPQVREHRL